MDIWSGLPPEQQQAIDSGQEAMTALNKCETVEHWHKVGNAFITMQQAVMSYCHTNKPTGKAYNAAWASLADKAPMLKAMDKSERSNAIWLATNWAAVKPWLDTLTGSSKRELNHPRSVRRKYDAARKVPTPADVQCAEAIVSMKLHIEALKKQEQKARDKNEEVLAAHLAGKIGEAEEELRNLQACGVKADKPSRIDLQDTITKLRERLDMKEGIKKGLLKPGQSIEALADLIDGSYKPDTVRKLVKMLNGRIKQAEKWEAQGK
jgi:hypothetical protein